MAERLKRAILIVLLSGCALRADFNAAAWHWRAPITLPPASSTAEFVVSDEVFKHSSAQLRDLRILRGGTIEVPYVVRLLGGALEQNEHAVTVRNKAWTKGIGVRAVLDLLGHAEHNRLRIATGQTNFKQTVIVETSDDAKHWSTVLSDGVIFNITRPEETVSDLTVAYPTSTRRFLRITVPGWTDPSDLESAWLAEYKESNGTREEFARLTPAVTENKEGQTTDLLFDLGFAGRPCDRLVLQVEPGLFWRSVEISTGDDAKTLTPRSGSWISRTKDDQNLIIDWSETWDRYIKLTVFNADSAPLQFGPATASAIRRVARFPSTPAGSYLLYSGNANARNPSYDFARVEDPSARAGAAAVGTAEANPAFQGPKLPFSERYPWALNLALGIAVAVMAFITYRFARQATSAKV